MGLAAPRKRVKISHDPNNTTWARSTDGFGHRIMKSQGWTPGSFLGARNASHADTFTKASASHIRVTLKDDTLGLGARPRGMGDDEPTGLDAFQGLLGRLNGKSEVQLEEEQRKRDDTRLAIYAQKKYQAVRFISGGYLVQEKSDILPKSNTAGRDKSDAENHLPSTDTKGDDANQGPREVDEEVAVSKSTSKEKTKKKDRKKKARSKTSSERTEKETSDLPKPSESRNEVVSQTITPSREQRPMGRHAIRGRHIQQKKRAIMDDRSLNEIFMVKT